MGLVGTSLVSKHIQGPRPRVYGLLVSTWNLIIRENWIKKIKVALIKEWWERERKGAKLTSFPYHECECESESESESECECESECESGRIERKAEAIKQSMQAPPPQLH
jgi:hypothetical protein